MFFKKPNASKVAFHYLIEILKQRNFGLLDTQFINYNVLRFGAVEIPQSDYEKLLGKSVALKTIFVDSKGEMKL